MSLLNLVELEAKKFSDARAELVKRVRALNDEVEAAKRKHLLGIRNAVDKTAEAHAALFGVIEENPALFEKPRTQAFYGIKCGYRKAKGKITWADDAQVVKLIRSKFPEQFDVLVKVTETPAKGPLELLDAKDLKAIGVSVSENGDEVFIKTSDSDIDKLVTALLKNAVEEAVES